VPRCTALTHARSRLAARSAADRREADPDQPRPQQPRPGCRPERHQGRDEAAPGDLHGAARGRRQPPAAARPALVPLPADGGAAGQRRRHGAVCHGARGPRCGQAVAGRGREARGTGPPAALLEHSSLFQRLDMGSPGSLLWRSAACEARGGCQCCATSWCPGQARSWRLPVPALLPCGTPPPALLHTACLAGSPSPCCPEARSHMW
jgi:hypothetical protein